MFCERCGMSIGEKSRYCPQCGSLIEKYEKFSVEEQTAKFCGGCGAPVQKTYCGNCGTYAKMTSLTDEATVGKHFLKKAGNGSKNVGKKKCKIELPKISMKVLSVLIALVLVVGVSVWLYKESQKIEFDEKMNSYDTFYLEDKKITLPISWSQLSKKGFHIEDSDEKKVSEGETIETNMYNSDEDCLGKIQISNGKVNKLTITADVDIYLYGGLSFSVTKDQVYEICGEPKYQIYEYESNSSEHFVDKEQEKKYKNDPEYKAMSSYVWCKNDYAYHEKTLNVQKVVYEVHSEYHYLRISFDSHNDVEEIVFYFDCADEEQETEETTDKQ